MDLNKNFKIYFSLLFSIKLKEIENLFYFKYEIKEDDIRIQSFQNVLLKIIISIILVFNYHLKLM
jgi:hypothetical protein